MVHRSKRVTRTGQTAAGAVGKEPVLTVLTLQAGVTVQAGALASGLVTLVRVQNSLGTTAAVTSVLWWDKTHGEQQRTSTLFSSASQNVSKAA